MMQQDLWNAPPGFRPSKSAPCSPVKPLGVARTRSDSFHITHKVPVGDTPYVRAKNVQLVDKDPEKAIPLFWAAINAGDRVDSALKDMAIVMKQQNRAEEAIEAIKSLRSKCSDQAQESLDNILLDLYKRCGRLEDQIGLLKHKLYLIQQGMAFNGKRTKTARSQGKKFQVSVEQEATRLLGNLGWAFMQQNNYVEAEDAYRRALLISTDNNKMCNLGICLMKQGRITEAKETLRRVRPAMADGPRGVDSHLKAFERAQQMLRDLESELMNRGAVLDRVEQCRLFDAFLGSSSIWQPQPCRESAVPPSSSIVSMSSSKPQDGFADENIDSTRTRNQAAVTNRPLQKSSIPLAAAAGGGAPLLRSNTTFNTGAPPFYSTQLATSNNPSGLPQCHDPFGAGLKRTRSVNSTGQLPMINDELRSINIPNQLPTKDEATKPVNLSSVFDKVEQNKSRRRSLPPAQEQEDQDVDDDNDDQDSFQLLPDKAFEEAILAAVLGSTSSHEVEANSNSSSMNTTNPSICQRKIEKRLRVFEDITLSMSPKGLTLI